MRARAIIVSIVVIIIGGLAMWGGQTLEAQQGLTPGTMSMNSAPTQLAPSGDRLIWAMNVSNGLSADWNMNVSYTSTGNSTMVIRDAVTGVTYEHLYQGCVFIGVPLGLCGGGREVYFTLPPAEEIDLQVLVHNNNTSVETLNDTVVAFSYVTHPDAVAGTDLTYVGAAAVVTGLIALAVTGTVNWRGHRGTEPGRMDSSLPNSLTFT